VPFGKSGPEATVVAIRQREAALLRWIVAEMELQWNLPTR